jgi:cellobiose dehydrogenase (acceptor)
MMPRLSTYTSLLLAGAYHALATSTENYNVTVTDSAWDYIIVGSGAGGIPVAAELAASGARTLLIERGPPSSGRWTSGQYGGLADSAWKPEWLSGTNLTAFDVMALYTEIWSGNYSKDILCSDVVGPTAGCVLGGGTAINAGLWWRPADIDWDYVFPGGSGWSSADMQNVTDRVFDRIPGTQVPSTDGELYLQQGAHIIEGALSQAGWLQEVPNDTPNQRTQRRVFSNTTFMYEHGERSGPMATYLVDAVQRPNFELWTNTMIERVVRDGSNATGVAVKSAGLGGKSGFIPLSGKGGVVLSAGAFGTPKILYRSGIGPRDQLEIVQAAEAESMINENQWIDLPVGYNLADNLNVSLHSTPRNRTL